MIPNLRFPAIHRNENRIMSFRFEHLSCHSGLLKVLTFLASLCSVLVQPVDAQTPDYVLKRSSDAPASLTGSMDFSNDGKLFAAVGLDKVIRIWDVSKLTETRHLDAPRSIHLMSGEGRFGYLFKASFSPDDRVLAIAANFGGFLISVETGQIAARLLIPSPENRLRVYPEINTVFLRHCQEC